MPNVIYSFDVFDTCITRPYILPTDLFEDLAKETLSHAGLDCSDVQVACLKQHRINAEANARRKYADLVDISIDRIYEALSHLVEPPISLNFMQSRELALELDSCSPISSILQEVSNARKLGKVVYISDMYLPCTLIQQMLRKCGFWSEGDRLYVSNEIGKSKHLGSVFLHVAEHEGVNPAQIHHRGDNKHADLDMARKYGASANRFVEGGLTSYEQNAIKYFDHRAARKFIGINRSIRLQASLTDDIRRQPPSALIHSVIAPFLVVFVKWVIQQAKRDGKERLYFVSRDAEIFYKIAKILCAGDESLECRYLFGSRKAWFAPSLQKCDKEEISWAYNSIMERTPKAILRRLDLNADEFIPTLERGGFPNIDEILNEQKTHELLSLIQESDIREAVLKHAKLNRNHALSYFEQEGLLEKRPWSIVDIGWVLNCQNALRRILKSANPAIDVHGYYLGVAENHIPKCDAGDFNGYFAYSSEESSRKDSCDWVFRQSSVAVLEHLFTPATHGTVLGYQFDSIWKPTNKEVSSDSDHQSWIREFQSMVEGHAQILAQSKLLDDNLEQIMPIANHLLKHFLAYPEKDDVSAVAWLKINIEQSHHKEYERTLASPLSICDLIDIVSHELNPKGPRYNHPDHAWLDGSAALSGSIVKSLYHTLKSLKRFRPKGKWTF